jgi:hypothetical protein
MTSIGAILRSLSQEEFLKVEQSAFIASESLSERIRQFRSDRIAKIIADETPVPLDLKPKIVLHVLPIESFTSGSSIDISLFEEEIKLKTIPETGYRSVFRYNFDGFCHYDYYDYEDRTNSSYVQMFRNGCIESVTSYGFYPFQNINIFDESSIEEELIKTTKEYLEVLKSKLEINPPILIRIGILGIKGYRIKWHDEHSNSKDNNEIDRDYPIIPELFIQSYDEKVSDILRPAFDTIWQACGYPRSKNYDSNGKRK